MNQLEQHALDAHLAGQSWSEFWARHGNAVRRAEPYECFHRLVHRLSHLLLTGEESGMHAVGDDDALEPWEVDDLATGLRRCDGGRSVVACHELQEGSTSVR